MTATRKKYDIVAWKIYTMVPTDAHMYLDEIIDPDDTRDVLVRALGRHADRPFRLPAERALRYWPTCW